MSTKLPELYKLLIGEDTSARNEEDVLKKINSYTELFEFKNSTFAAT